MVYGGYKFIAWRLVYIMRHCTGNVLADLKSISEHVLAFIQGPAFSNQHLLIAFVK
jgi:hypothetical protein